jgi:hypothetical protein
MNLNRANSGELFSSDDESKSPPPPPIVCNSDYINDHLLNTYANNCDSDDFDIYTGDLRESKNVDCKEEAKSKRDKLNKYNGYCTYNTDCNPNNFENYMSDFKQGIQVDKLGKMLSSEIKCHDENINTPPVGNDRLYGGGYDDDKFDYRDAVYNTDVLFQKLVTNDIRLRITQSYVQEYNDKCSIVALHNIGILCRDNSAQLRAFQGGNFNVSQMLEIVRRNHIRTYPLDKVTLAYFVSYTQVIPYLTANLNPDNITLMLVEYYNIDFDADLPEGHVTIIPEVPAVPGVPAVPSYNIYNYRTHTHAVLVKNEIGAIVVYEPFKTVPFPILAYLNNFNVRPAVPGVPVVPKKRPINNNIIRRIYLFRIDERVLQPNNYNIRNINSPKRKSSLKLKRKVSPKLKRRVSPKLKRRVSPKLKRRVSPKLKRKVSPKLKRRVSPKLKRRVSPKLKRKVSPKLKRRVSPKLKRKVSPKLKRRVSPKLKRKVSPKLKRKVSPKLKRKVSPKLKRRV